MKFTVPYKEFYRAAKELARVVDHRNAETNLRDILIQIGPLFPKVNVTMTARRSDRLLEKSIPVEKATLTEDDYGVLDNYVFVEARALANTLAKGNKKKKSVTVEIDENHVYLRHGSKQVKLAKQENEKLRPAIGKFMDHPITTGAIKIDAKIFQEAIAFVKSCMPKYNMRRALNSARLYTKDLMLKIEATDGHRLARFTIGECKEIFNDLDKGILLPTEELLFLKSIMPKGRNEVILMVAESVATFTWEGSMYAINLLEGKYPDTSKLETPEKLIFQVEASLLFEAADRLLCIYDAADRQKPIKLICKDAKIYLETRKHYEADGWEYIEVDDTPNEFSFHVNGKYLLDVLGQMRGQMIKVLACDGLRADGLPILFVPEDDREEYLLMPMRGSW